MVQGTKGKVYNRLKKEGISMLKRMISFMVSVLMIFASWQRVTAQNATLKASHFKSDRVDLKWNAFGKKYTIYRKTGKTYKKIATTKATHYTDRKLDDRKSYTYFVKAGQLKSNSVTKRYSHVTFAKEKTLWDHNMSKAHKKAVSDYAAQFVNTKLQKGMPTAIRLAQAARCVYKQAYYEQNYKYHTSVSYGPVKYHKADCGGYAALFKALCDAMKIDCWVVQPGINVDKVLTAHIFNLVKYQGKWYEVDAEDGILEFEDGDWLSKVNKKGKWVYKDAFEKAVKKEKANVDTSIKVQHIPYVEPTYKGYDDEYANMYLLNSGSVDAATYDEALSYFQGYFKLMSSNGKGAFATSYQKLGAQWQTTMQLFAQKNSSELAQFNEALNLYKSVTAEHHRPDEDVTLIIDHLNDWNGSTRLTLRLNYEEYSNYRVEYVFDINGNIVSREGNPERTLNEIKETLHMNTETIIDED